MPTDDPQPLGSILDDVLQRLNTGGKIDEARVVEAWATLVGPQINKVTESVWMNGRRLFVKIRSSAWRQELHLQRQQWRTRLNEELGQDLIQEVVFR
jgi:predicted nucleic acid-binding Zn ribbon protein